MIWKFIKGQNPFTSAKWFLSKAREAGDHHERFPEKLQAAAGMSSEDEGGCQQGCE
jgi:hypothetical protein